MRRSHPFMGINQFTKRVMNRRDRRSGARECVLLEEEMREPGPVGPDAHPFWSDAFDDYPMLERDEEILFILAGLAGIEIDAFDYGDMEM